MKLILFDIDGTLVNTGGAGSRAFSRALETTFGLSGGLNGVRLDGKTDLQIVREVFQRQGLCLEVSEESARELFGSYVEFLEGELDEVGLQYQVLPGVSELLSDLNCNPAFLLGIASGNIAEGARLKLEKGRLNKFFPIGGFGSDAESRTELIRIAIQRAAEYVNPGQLNSVTVIGDTPRDISHGQEAGARVIAVASGFYTLNQLKECRPNLAVESLSPIEPVLEFLNAE